MLLKVKASGRFNHVVKETAYFYLQTEVLFITYNAHCQFSFIVNPFRKHLKYYNKTFDSEKKEQVKASEKREKNKSSKKEINLPYNLYDKKHSKLDQILEKSEDEQHKYGITNKC